jgi:hypothetical protein
MAKGLFTQGFCLLTDGTTTLDHLRPLLEEKDYEIVKQAPPQKDWRFGGPTLVVSVEPEVNGYVAIDVVNERWPDSMGNPKDDSKTFAAWTSGHFGPFAFPGGLIRAGEQSWSWEGGRNVVTEQRGFVRLRMSYSFGAKDKDLVLPKDYDALAELLFLSQMVLPLLRAPGVLCYFNPSGEVLRDQDTFRQLWKACKEQEKIPLGLWCNIRFYKVNERLNLMDTVGNGQLDLQDVEAFFPNDLCKPEEIDLYLQNVSIYLMGLDRPLQTGEEIDGPGEHELSWTLEVLKNGTIEPPRRTIRLYPKANQKEVKDALAATGRS